MRKITQQSAQALHDKEFYNKGNTRVSFGYVNADTSELDMEMRLHNNLIATTTRDTLTITDAGWQTVTTKERLNGVLHYFNLGHLFQKDYVWYYAAGNGCVKPFSGSMTFKI